MADKKLNEVTKVTDMAYVPVIMSDGSIGQIAKADLASVVAGVNSIYRITQSLITISGMVCRIKNISDSTRSVGLLCIAYKGSQSKIIKEK